MGIYTTELRFICESLAGESASKGYNNVNSIIGESWDKIFDFDFPIFDEEYRSVLCQKILKHYYTREIGLETYGLWKLKLDSRMNEIMPYYNKLYNTESLQFNPLYDVNYTKEHSGEGGGSEENNGSHTGTVNDAATHGGNINDIFSKDGTINDEKHNEDSGTNWDAYSDTPQGSLSNVDTGDYLTNARKVTNSNENDETFGREYEESGGNTRTFNETNGNLRTYNEATGVSKEFSTTTEYTEHISGKIGSKSYASMIMEYRKSLLNIDIMVIDELKDLFMGLWK